MAKWEKVKLGDVLEVQKKSKIKAGSGLKFGMYPFFTSSSSLSKYVNEAEYYKPAIIFGTGGMANIHFCETPFSVSTDCLVFYAKGSNVNVNLNYIYKFFIGHMYKLEEGFKGAGLKHISKTFLENIIIPLPPLEEQKKIAERLDAVSDLLEKQKQLLAEQDNLIKSIFYDMFGDPTTNTKNWKQGKIKDVVEDIQYGLSEKADEIGEFPILRMNNISYSGEMDYSDLKYVNKKPDEKYFLKKGDILFNRTNSKDLVGKTGMYDKDDAMLYAGYLIRIRTKDDCLPIFLKTYMNLPQLKVYFREKCKSIVGMANINAKEVQSISFYLPPIELQHKFATIVEGIEAQKEKIKSSIAETQTLFASLMAKYFDEEQNDRISK